MKKEIFTEIGFDPDNNKYFLVLVQKLNIKTALNLEKLVS
jgi:hypothetical protein